MSGWCLPTPGLTLTHTQYSSHLTIIVYGDDGDNGVDHNDGSLPFHRLTKPSGAKVVGPKTIVKPLGSMVGGAIEKPLLPFHRLTNG